MDERLEAGRHHLTNGSRALDQGYPDDARAFYRAALLQFRGPELRLGEAHALRGLARVELIQGRDDAAADLATQAVRAYEDLVIQLQEIDPEGVSEEFRRGANEGEAAAEILLSELRARGGLGTAAREHLGRARALATSVGSNALVADVETALGRLAMREGQLEQSETHLQKACQLYQRSEQRAGEASVVLIIAETRRLRGDRDGTRLALEHAGRVSNGLGSDRIAGRIAWTRAALDLGAGDLWPAKLGFEAAIPVLHRAGDFEMEAHAILGLAEVSSRRGEPGVRPRLLEAGRRLAATGDAHGVATVLLVAGEFAVRVGEPEIGAALAAGAHRLWLRTDPIRGVGQAFRLLARALYLANRPRTALWVALAREAVAGRDQPGAGEVARWHLERANEDDVLTATGLSGDALRARAEGALPRDIEPVLARAGLPLEALDGVEGALTALEILVGLLPDLAPEAAAPGIPAGHPTDEEQPTGAFVALGALRAGKGGTPSPAPTRGAYPPRSDDESSR